MTAARQAWQRISWTSLTPVVLRLRSQTASDVSPRSIDLYCGKAVNALRTESQDYICHPRLQPTTVTEVSA